MAETDIRIVKTMDAIKESFLQCLQEFGFQNMTVKNITEKARINRSTFYAYYMDKYDLRDRYADSVIEEFTENLDVEFIKKKEITAESYYNELRQCLDAFMIKKREYLILWNANLADRNVFDEMIESGIRKFVKEFMENPDISEEKTRYFGLYANLFLGNMMVSIRWWFQEGQDVDADTFTKMMIRHMGQSIFHTLKGK